jgi:drug/metabolite transporter (DMT)-like permease
VLVYLIIHGQITAEFFQLQQMDWFYLFVLSSVCTAYAFIASVKVMKYISPYTVMLTINLEPIYAIILALFIFGDKEKMNPEFYLGAAIVLGVVLANGVIKNRATIKEKLRRKMGSKK